MPLRLPASPHPSTGPGSDTSRRWLWVALLTGLLALVLAGAAMAQCGGGSPAACPASRAFLFGLADGHLVSFNLYATRS